MNGLAGRRAVAAEGPAQGDHRAGCYVPGQAKDPARREEAPERERDQRRPEVYGARSQQQVLHGRIEKINHVFL